jgi:uncharacterized protein YcaQ
MNTTISKQQARQFILKKQLLLYPKSLNRQDGIEEVFNTLRIIQYDPLNPCGRNPDLVLQSRIKNYHPNDYYKWLYEDKKGIEVYDKELCIIPIEDLDYVSHRQLKAQQDKSRKSFLKVHNKEVSLILEQIKQNGPLSSADIKLNKQVISGWGSTALVGRIALEQLWKMGQLIVVKREGMKKYYDLPEKINPPTKLAKEHILRRLKSVGILPKTTTGGGWQGLSGISPFINSLIKEQKILEIKIEDAKLTYLILKEDYELIRQPAVSLIRSKISFIAPLDNLIWDRKMIEDIFNFHYRWEVYTPQIKRQFGYYVLPILYGDEFIGRIEPVKNSKTNTLEIKGLWYERKWNKKELNAFEKALTEFGNYLQTNETILQIPTQ